MILMNDFRRLWADTEADLTAAFREVGESGWYILGEQVRAFEADLASFWGLTHAVGVASGLDAIEIGLRVLGCQPGDRVLTTPLSAFATTLAIVKLGAVPVYVDVDASGLIDLNQCEEVLRRGGVRFFVPVHLYGHAIDLDAMAQLRDRFDLKIVEDCAQSIGARSRKRATGTVGQIAATSFYPTKNLGAIGDAGALLTPDASLAERARSLRDYGQSAKYKHTEIGYNSRLDELQAALMRRAFLPRLEKWTEHRRAIAARYLQQLNGVEPLAVPEHSESCWHLFPTLARDRVALAKSLRDAGILTGEHYPILIPDQEAMRGVPHEVAFELTQARHIAANELSLPIHPYLTEEEADRVCATVNERAASL
jgi:dTDP-3-amino-3,4,6-trideoxy-alpha-D-glucose transaminase